MTDLEFLIAAKSYIEDMEETVDGEWGGGRSFEELIKLGLMPEPLYSEVICRLKALTPTSEIKAIKKLVKELDK
jgi:hypothetical protein